MKSVAGTSSSQGRRLKTSKAEPKIFIHYMFPCSAAFLAETTNTVLSQSNDIIIQYSLEHSRSSAFPYDPYFESTTIIRETKKH